MKLALLSVFLALPAFSQSAQPQKYVSVDPSTSPGAGKVGSAPQYNFVLHRLWNCHQTTGSACTWERSDGAGSGTVTVVASGNLTSTACVTGGGSQAVQTPNAGCTIDTSGNISTPGTITSTATGPGTITLGPTIVGSLPTCSSPNNGMRASVTDATATTFLSVVVGGGGQNVPVYCDGSGNWRIG